MLQDTKYERYTPTVELSLFHFLSQVYYQPTKSYQVNDRSYSTDLQTVNTTGTRVTIASGLYPASTYTVYVTSTNAAGEGVKSTSVSAVLAPKGE